MSAIGSSRIAPIHGEMSHEHGSTNGSHGGDELQARVATFNFKATPADKLFASNVFGLAAMKEHSQGSVQVAEEDDRDRLRSSIPKVADVVATAMKDWAI